MNAKSISVPGSPEPTTSGTLELAEVAVTARGRVRCAAARAGAAPVLIPDVLPDDVVKVEYANGFVEWLRADDFYQEHAAGPHRGIAPAAGNILAVDPGAPADAGERGVVGIAISALEIFGIDLKQKAAATLCRTFEKRLIGAAGSRVVTCSLGDDFALGALPGGITGGQEPLLVFIHGTASSTHGSFGKLWDPHKSPGGQKLRKALAASFGERVYALEHRTFSESPVENALTLVRALPRGARLALVTHSRGGLIGDLLCLGTRLKDGGDKLTDALLDQICMGDNTVSEALGLAPLAHEDAGPGYYEKLRKDFRELLTLLDEKALQIDRFVRVASPSRGTTLASGRLDRWLSVLNFVADKSGVPLLGDGLDVLLALVKERTDPRTLPGLEAMMPGSAVTRLVNFPGIRVEADLSVIAGDLEPGSTWARLANFAVDRFFGDANDLVVNTGSMYGGSPRTKDQARFALDRGSEVNHFNYFSNDKTVGLLGLALGTLGTPPGFQAIATAQHVTPSRAAVLRSQAGGPKPILIVVPGTMGSQLKVGDDHVWLDYFDLALGGLGQLRIDAHAVAPLNLLDDFYGEFLVHATGSHEVQPYAYDWRLSITTLAEQFAVTLAAHLNTCRRIGLPLRIAAHSMGGLVVRATFAQRPDLWQQFQAIPGSRFVMFGTPNRGSLEAMRWLTGFNPTLRKLCLLDVTRGTNGIIDIVRRFPGLLELLPADHPEHDFTRVTLWRELRDAMRNTWPLAEASDLARLSASWQLVEHSPTDRDRMIYVAGCATATVVNYHLLPSDDPPWSGRMKTQRLQFDYTAEGDGTVTWQSGLLEGVPTYYVAQTGHDALLGAGAPFPAYMDLLVNGRTSALPQSPPLQGVRGVAAIAPLPAPGAPAYMPGPEEIAGFTFGGGRADLPRERQSSARIEVSVRHGDLTYARYPVVVGHYQGDSILSAERVLDHKLDGALSQRMRLGLYPGPRNTCAVFLPKSDPASVHDGRTTGAVVIGLGQVGELGPGSLQSGMTAAMLELALRVEQSRDDTFAAAEQSRAIKICCLLIGSGMAGMDMRESLESMLRGILAANEALQTQELSRRVQIAGVEFLELYEDIAIAAARALTGILAESDLAEAVVWSPAEVVDSGNGRRRSRFDARGDWWSRLQIVHDVEQDVLRFTDFGKSARAEEDMVRDELHTADRFIDEVSGTTARDSRTAQTLFEMLLPNRLKNLAPEAHDRVLLLDERSARYPWELLEDRWSRRGEPPAIAGGLLRQLVTLDYRELPRWSAGDAALVIGNPVLSPDARRIFPALPGARREAEVVDGALRDAGFKVDLCIDGEGSEILKRLHDDAWRILHLAGHGVHDYAVTRESLENGLRVARSRIVSGMVIGADHFLTPGVVQQMRNVPQLVFINCCHLGATTSNAHSLPGFAANLAVQFIKMGVRAVIAAGWAVDDRAAELFAATFYREMSGGRAFGDAVHEARRAAYRAYPNVNTWGAYQCYGDPDFRLRHFAGGGGRQRAAYVAPREMVIELQNFARGIKMGGAGTPAYVQERIERCVASIPPGQNESWLARADVAAALGEAYGEAGDYAGAARWLDVVMRANDANVAVRSIERLSNWAVRQSMDDWLGAHHATPSDRKACKVATDTLLKLRGYLEALDAIGPTLERKAILGSASKRLARMLVDGRRARARHAALEAMQRYYDEAFRLSQQAGRPEFYPLVNRLAADAVLAWRAGDRELRMGATKTDAATARALAAKAMGTNPDFWALVVAPDCDIALALMSLDATERDDLVKAAIDGYRYAFNAGSSPSQRNSILEHHVFLSEMAAAEDQQEAMAMLSRLRAELAEFWGARNPAEVASPE